MAITEFHGAIFLQRDSEFPKIEFVAGDAKIFDDIGDDAARHVARMPRKRDDALRMEGIRVVAVTARTTKVLATDVPESSFKLPTVIGRYLPTNQAARINLSRNGGGIGRPVSRRASK
jgi:hypothetical protein